MRAKQDASDARRALEIRRIQEQAALERLRAQAIVEAHARQVLDARMEDHAGAQDGWADVLRHSTYDAESGRLWRAHAESALRSLRTQEDTLRTEAARSTEHQDDWRRQLRLADAAQTVERRSAAALRRRLDERSLMTAEDLFHAVRSGR